MKLEGEKVYLKPVIKKDLPTFVRWLSDTEVIRYAVMQSYTLEEEIEWYKKIQADPNETIFSIYLKKSNKLIGNCGVHHNSKRDDQYNGETFVGIIIGEKDVWGKGYGTDAFKTLLKYIKDKLKVPHVFLTVATLNKPAQRVYQKCGFEFIEKRRNPDQIHSNQKEYVMRVDL